MIEHKSPEDTIGYFCRHFVSLSWTDYPVDENGLEHSELRRSYHTSGFVMSFRGDWYWVTAGHVINDINAALENPRQRIEHFWLADHFGLDLCSREPIPFSYDPETAVAVDSGGLDFGLVPLRDLYRQNLERNGIVAIAEENWYAQPRVEWDYFFLLGIPETGVTDQGIKVHMLPVEALVNPMSDPCNTEYPQFVGRLMAPETPLTLSIVGMSGGPIFGFRRGPDGLRSWIVAVQSGWYKPERIVYGCNVFLLGALLEAFQQTFEAKDTQAQ